MSAPLQAPLLPPRKVPNPGKFPLQNRGNTQKLATGSRNPEQRTHFSFPRAAHRQCWQLNIFEKCYFALKKERSGRDRRIQQKREAREKRSSSGHWLWDTAGKGSRTREKGQRNEAGFPPESTQQPLLCTSALPCHQNQPMAWFINSHKPALIFTLVKKF